MYCNASHKALQNQLIEKKDVSVHSVPVTPFNNDFRYFSEGSYSDKWNKYRNYSVWNELARSYDVMNCIISILFYWLY